MNPKNHYHSPYNRSRSHHSSHSYHQGRRQAKGIGTATRYMPINHNKNHLKNYILLFFKYF